MKKTIFKNINAPLLILGITASSSSIQPNWRTYASEHSVELCAITAVCACIIGKITYETYLNKICPTEKAIEHCRSTYTHVYADIQRCYHTYKNESQSSDWELKDSIFRIKTPYPFMTYHQQIIQSIFQLIKHNTTVKHELEIIAKQKSRIRNNSSQASILIMEELKHLEIKGKLLQEHIKRTLSTLSILKKRIIVFREYNDDCHNWSYEKHTKFRSHAVSKKLHRMHNSL